MKKNLFLVFGLLFNSIISTAQSIIPTGISTDSIYIKEMFDVYNVLRFYYYKPVSYDSASSPLLFAIHGLNGNGLSPINDLQNIAERRKALIIAPDLGTGGFYGDHPEYSFLDSLYPNQTHVL